MQVMQDTGAIFSGSHVLRFIDRSALRSDWAPGDLDIYTVKEKAPQLIKFFEDEEYKGFVKPRGRKVDRHYVAEGAIACAVTLKKSGHPDVDVVISSAESPIIPIARFYATHVVNVITGYSVNVAYPKATLNGKSYLRYWAPDTDTMEYAINKYNRRGYTILRSNDSSEATLGDAVARFYCPHTTRSFTDEGTLTIPFAGKGTGKASERDAVILGTACWRWGGNGCTCCANRSGEVILDNLTGKAWCEYCYRFLNFM